MPEHRYVIQDVLGTKRLSIISDLISNEAMAQLRDDPFLIIAVTSSFKLF